MTQSIDINSLLPDEDYSADRLFDSTSVTDDIKCEASEDADDYGAASSNELTEPKPEPRKPKPEPADPGRSLFRCTTLFEDGKDYVPIVEYRDIKEIKEEYEDTAPSCSSATTAAVNYNKVSCFRFCSEKDSRN